MALRQFLCAVAFVSVATSAAADPVIDFNTMTSAREPHPLAVAAAPIDGAIHVTGGGAQVNWTGPGSLLFNTSPRHGTREWVAQAKDHWASDPSSVKSVVVFFDDPARQYEVRAFYSPSSATSRTPSATASVPRGWVLTGGGCSVDWRSNMGPGSMLTGSYPQVRPDSTADTWVCETRDLNGSSPANVIAVAIGLRPALDAERPARMPIQCVAQSVSNQDAHPAARAPNCAATRGGQITGGGGRAATPNAGPDRGQFLYATMPVLAIDRIDGWEARSKDHLVSAYGTVTAYAIALTF